MTPGCVFDFPDGPERQPLRFGAPREVLRADTLDAVRGVLRAAEARARAGAWVGGFVAYEAAPAFDPAFQVRAGDGSLPLAWFGVFAAPLPETPCASPGLAAANAWHPSIDRARFDADIAAIRAAIADGEAYQVNHTLRLRSRHDGDALAWFQRLRAAQPNSYAAYLELGAQRILSLSPELFFRRDGDIITAKPMKGTASRGRWPEEDDARADWLRHSDKNRAENLMIVDLLRNDLARVATPHGVRVPELFAVERHPTVLQMTSTITAQARPDTGLDAIFGALFPCGSITGAPKAKAMEIIARRETTPRGVYCGAIGLVKPGGDAIFNVAIRSVVLDAGAGSATCGVGAGITWDSSAADEYAEVLLKSRFLAAEAADFELFETLRLEGGRFVRLDRHLARLAASARYFDFPFDTGRCRRQLASHVGACGARDARVRLRLARDGACAVNIEALPDAVAAPARFAIAATPVDSGSVWLYHKTTRRQVYERAAAMQRNVFDVLLWNERRELTEFTRGNLVLDIDGRRLTPRRDCGLLDGCRRRELLDAGVIAEAVLTLDDLERAERVWFINSLRGDIELRHVVQEALAA